MCGVLVEYPKNLNLGDCTTRLKLRATWIFLKEIFSLCSVRQVAKSCNHQVKDKPLSQHAPLRKQPVDDMARLAKRIGLVVTLSMAI